jgi:23S rRNA (guanine1835-N2)-methyltransferase
VNRVLYPGQDFSPRRYPESSNRSLQAWDSADELILAELQRIPDLKNLTILLVQDAFGALAKGLEGFQREFLNDSHCAHIACRENAGELTRHHSFETVRRNSFDLVIIKLPKSLEYAKYLLIESEKMLKTGGRIICGAKSKALTSSFYSFFKSFAEMQSSPAQKKSRLVYLKNCSPGEWEEKTFKFEGISVHSLPGTFSHGRADLGSMLLLQNLLPRLDAVKPKNLLDLGCGNGILSAVVQNCIPEIAVTALDDSYQAIVSARRTIKDLGKNTFIWSDIAAAEIDEKFELILINPPFHQQGSIAVESARNMFSKAARLLAADGELWIVANRHLGYHKLLNSLFSHLTIEFEDKGYAIYSAHQKS